MSRLFSKSEMLKGALLYVGIGILLQVIGLWQFALIFWGVAVIFGLRYWHLATRDRRLAQVNQAAAVRPQPVAPPKASPDSSSLELPEFD